MKLFKSQYNILDLNIFVESDTIDFIEMIDLDYSWFKQTQLNNFHLHFRVMLQNSENSLVIFPENDQYDLSGYIDKKHLAYQIILKTIFSKIDNYLVIHAGVVIFKNKALVLAGPPGIGKSTLVFELIKNNFIFYSDDFCPINRKNNLVYPFPRSLWLDLKNNSYEKNTLRNKHPIDINMYKNCMPNKYNYKPSEINWIVYLDHCGQKNNNCEIFLYLKNSNTNIFKDFDKIDQLQVIKDDKNIRLKFQKGIGISKHISLILEKYKNNVINVFRKEEIFPDFSKQSQFQKIKSSKSAFLLIHDLKNFFSINNYIQSKAQLLMELSFLLKNTKAYKMTTGNLDSMQKNIYKIINSDFCPSSLDIPLNSKYNLLTDNQIL